jgi:ABC-2 type transport system permease protein
MLALFRKEVNLFLSSLIGYIAIGLFLLANGLICWVFTDSNILDGGYANLDPLFQFAPWVFLLLIPAITMRSFAEEQETGTMELLATKPITDGQIIAGKFLAAFFLVVFSILPTLVYAAAISALASPPGNIDSGAIAGSYLGLLLLGAGFVSVGLFASSLTRNQIVSFIAAMFACFVFYQAFDSLALLPGLLGSADKVLLSLSMGAHYRNLSMGLIETRDVVYFLSVVAFFFLLTKTVLSSRKW